MPQNGVLLLVIAGGPSRNLKTYVQTALSNGPSIGKILIVGEKKDEQALKQLKVEMYGLAGSLKRELGLRVEYLEGALSEEQLRKHLDSVLERGNQGSAGEADKKELQGVLCDLDASADQPLDVLEVESAVLMDQWSRSVGFVHNIARTTIPLLRVAAHRAAQVAQAPERTLKCPFFITTLSSSTTYGDLMHITALCALLSSLSTLGNREITFGSADVLLAPEPEPEPERIVQKEQQPVVAPTNGWNDQADDFEAGESPTKLWGMWSNMQDQLGSL